MTAPKFQKTVQAYGYIYIYIQSRFKAENIFKTRYLVATEDVSGINQALTIYL